MKIKVSAVILLLALCSVQPSSAFQYVMTIGNTVYTAMEMSSYILMTNDSTESMINTLQGSIISMQNGTDLRVIFDVITELQDQAWDGDEKNGVDRWKSQLQDYISNIGSNFERLSQLIKKGKEAPAQDWDSFVNYTMENIEENVSPLPKKIFPGRKRPKGTGYIFDLALTSNDLRRKHCREALAMQSFLSHLFQTVMVTEAKAMLSLTYAILIQNSSYEARTYKLWQLTVDFKDRFNYYMVRTAEAMSIAPHQTTPCDPPNGTRIRDETYFEIERLEQVSVFQFSDTSNSRDCANAVEKKTLTFYSERDICKGSLSDCEYSGWLDVCRLENSSKRYEWIKSEGGDYGMNFDKCPSGTITKYEGNNNSSNGHCICKCREAGNWMSVSPVMANVSDNMVVIGSRFMRKEGVLYLQLKQGRLLANGWIDPSSQEWIPLPKNPVLMAINSTHNKFYLDNVPLPMGHVVVGAQLEYDEGFSLVVFGVKFSFSSGNMRSSILEKFAHHDNYDQLELPRKNSIYTNLKHMQVSNKQWIELQVSDWKHDAGQSVLPLFDGVAIETDPPVPLGGIGIVHKGVTEYAGFISPKLYSLPYLKIMKTYINQRLNWLAL